MNATVSNGVAGPALSLDALAAALMNLSPADRAKLVALLTTGAGG